MRLSRIGDLLRNLAAISLLLGAVLTAIPAAAQDDLSSEPFTVFVAYEKAFARCGPSDEYYRTDELRHGQQLDVYLETEDGWLGVRPPENSFCWVPASAVEIAKGGETGTISEDRTVSWIGTQLGRARQYRWQVQMAEGEQVTILGRSERDGPDGPQTWLRIVPPSGEFRWVHRDQIVDSAEALVANLRPDRATEETLAVGEDSAESRHDQKPENGLDKIARTASSIKQRLGGDSASNDSVESSRSYAGTPNRKPTLALSSETPHLKTAPPPQSEAERVVGSGLGRQWDSNVNREAVSQAPADSTSQADTPQADQTPPIADAGDVASTEFIGRPRLLEIGAGNPAPRNNVAAADSNWVMGVSRLQSAATAARNVQPAAYQDHVQPSAAQARTVPAASINHIENEVRDADVEKLQLLLSRLMASSASAAELEPVASRARNLSMTSLNQVAAGRARLVAERAEQYQGVARRRDGNTVIRENGVPVIPASGTLSQSRPHMVSTPPTMQSQPNREIRTGFLVQVYSARANSPPFALTDHAGNTIAYVTPSPGINLRGHLNSHIKVIGTRGFLQGLNMPHIVASQAARTPE